MLLLRRQVMRYDLDRAVVWCAVLCFAMWRCTISYNVTATLGYAMLHYAVPCCPALRLLGCVVLCCAVL